MQTGIAAQARQRRVPDRVARGPRNERSKTAVVLRRRRRYRCSRCLPPLALFHLGRGCGGRRVRVDVHHVCLPVRIRIRLSVRIYIAIRDVRARRRGKDGVGEALVVELQLAREHVLDERDHCDVLPGHPRPAQRDAAAACCAGHERRERHCRCPARCDCRGRRAGLLQCCRPRAEVRRAGVLRYRRLDALEREPVRTPSDAFPQRHGRALGEDLLKVDLLVLDVVDRPARRVDPPEGGPRDGSRGGWMRRAAGRRRKVTIQRL